MKKYNIFFMVLSVIFLMSGCATVKETARGIAGISTKQIEDTRPSAMKEIFSYDYNTCQGKVQDALDHIGTYTYTRNKAKNLIAVYISREDTTPVGIFLKEIDPTHTQVEVSSPSTYGKELIFRAISSNLGDKADKVPVEKQVKQAMAYISDAEAAPAQKIEIPVSTSDVSGFGFISCQLSLEFDPALLSLISIERGELTKDWSAPVYKVTEGKADASLYGTTAISGAGTVANLVFKVKDNAKAGNTSLNLREAKFNDGKIPSKLSSGQLRITAKASK